MSGNGMVRFCPLNVSPAWAELQQHYNFSCSISHLHQGAAARTGVEGGRCGFMFSFSLFFRFLSFSTRLYWMWSFVIHLKAIFIFVHYSIACECRESFPLWMWDFWTATERFESEKMWRAFTSVFSTTKRNRGCITDRRLPAEDAFLQ